MAEDPGCTESGAAAADDRLVKAHRIFVRLVLPPYTAHFNSPGYIKDATLDMLDERVCRATLRLTTQQKQVRCVEITIIASAKSNPFDMADSSHLKGT